MPLAHNYSNILWSLGTIVWHAAHYPVWVCPVSSAKQSAGGSASTADPTLATITVVSNWKSICSKYTSTGQQALCCTNLNCKVSQSWGHHQSCWYRDQNQDCFYLKRVNDMWETTALCPSFNARKKNDPEYFQKHLSQGLFLSDQTILLLSVLINDTRSIETVQINQGDT